MFLQTSLRLRQIHVSDKAYYPTKPTTIVSSGRLYLTTVMLNPELLNAVGGGDLQRELDLQALHEEIRAAEKVKYKNLVY